MGTTATGGMSDVKGHALTFLAVLLLLALAAALVWLLITLLSSSKQ